MMVGSNLAKPHFLHPLSLVFEIASMIRGNLIPTIVAVVGARNGGWIGFGVAAAVFVIGLVVACFRFFTYRYYLSDSDLIINQGLFGRLHRTIPIHRIQNIDLSQNLFHRWFKVCEVRVETASGQKPEAIMRVLALSEYSRLKDELAKQRGSLPTSALAQTESNHISLVEQAAANEIPKPQAKEILVLPTRLVVLAGLLSNRGEVIAGIVIGFLWQLRFGDFWMPDVNRATRDATREHMKSILADGVSLNGLWRYLQENVGMYLSFAMLALGIIALVIVLRAFSAIWYVLKFYGYRLELADDVLHVRCGLFTKVSATIPCGRVQLVSVQRNWLANQFGLASIRIETAGGGDGKSEDLASSVGRRWFVPVMLYKDVPRVLKAIDSRIEFDEPTIEWKPIAKNAAKRMLRPLLIVAVLWSCIGFYFFPTWGWIAGVLIAIAGTIYVRKKSKSRRYARTDWGVIYRSGTLFQKCSMTFFDKIQSAHIQQSPFDRRWEMGTLVFDTAFAGPANHQIRIELLGDEFALQEFESLKSKMAIDA